MAREDRETEEQQEEVRQNDPFMAQVGRGSLKSAAMLEAGYQELPGKDDGRAGDGNGEVAVMEDCGTRQRQGKEDEVDRGRSDMRGHGSRERGVSARSEAQGILRCPNRMSLDYRTPSRD